MAVKLYTLEELKTVNGLYPDKALSKMNGDMEIYSALLDKFLNQAPRAMPRLKQLLKEGKLAEYSEELKDLRIDLADIFALDMYERANLLFTTAEKGSLDICRQQIEPFTQALQSFAYELKQCRTQDAIENEEEAVNKAVELDIGASVVNNKYSTINKSKFIELYKRISKNLTDKAINLTNVLRAMGYDAEIGKYLNNILSDLSNQKVKSALTECGRLLTLLGCTVPESENKRFTVMLADTEGLFQQVTQLIGGLADVKSALDAVEFKKCAAEQPDFILINKAFCGNGFTFAEQLKSGPEREIPLGFLFTAPTSGDILAAHSLGAVEFFILPLSGPAFVEKISKYMK